MDKDAARVTGPRNEGQHSEADEMGEGVRSASRHLRRADLRVFDLQQG